MTFSFNNQILDIAVVFLLVWNIWVFILNKSDREDIIISVKIIPSYIRVPIVICVCILLALVVLTDLGVIDYLNNFLIITIALWSYWLWMTIVFWSILRYRKKVARKYNPQDSIRLIGWLFVGAMLLFVGLDVYGEKVLWQYDCRSAFCFVCCISKWNCFFQICI